MLLHLLAKSAGIWYHEDESAAKEASPVLVSAVIDRPLGSVHPHHPDIVYPVNYGEVPGIPAPDGDWQDVYVLGVDVPIAAFTGRRIAIIHRRDDAEDKWVLAPEGMTFTAEEIMRMVRFQEQYFDAWVEMTQD